MPKLTRGIVRLLAVAAVMALMQPMFLSVTSALTGREFSRCIHACNESRRICNDRCVTDCTAMFPAGTQRDACIDACRNTCVEQSKDCKAVCKGRDVTPTPP